MMNKLLETVSEECFAHFLNTEGDGIMISNGETVEFKKGDKLLFSNEKGYFQIERKSEAP